MKILSISDVITNSSSEVFVLSDIESIKDYDDLEVFDSATYAKELFKTKEEKEQEEGNIE